MKPYKIIHAPSLSNVLILVFIISFGLQWIIPGYRDALVFSTERIFFDPWRLITATFIHLNLLHLFVNVYPLFLIGNALEKRIRKKSYLIMLFVGSALGYIYQYLTWNFGFDTIVIGLGSSAGVSTLLAASALLMPDTKVKVFWIPAKFKYLAILFFTIEIFALIIGNTTTYHEAHLIGGLFGVLYVKLLQRKEKARQKTS